MTMYTISDSIALSPRWQFLLKIRKKYIYNITSQYDLKFKL